MSAPGRVDLHQPPQLVILDRDDTIVRGAPEGRYLLDPDDVSLLPGASEAIALLGATGAAITVATNQRCIALGLVTAEGVAAIHQRVNELLTPSGAHIERFYVCPHGLGECTCRKPSPGMLLQAMAEFAARPERTVMIGDRQSDMDAARAAGVRGMRIGSRDDPSRPDLLAIAREFTRPSGSPTGHSESPRLA